MHLEGTSADEQDIKPCIFDASGRRKGFDIQQLGALFLVHQKIKGTPYEGGGRREE
jgi:hypothetical protein